MKIPSRYRKLVLRLMVLGIVFFGIQYYQTHYANAIAMDDMPSEVSHQVKEIPWWDKSYPYRTQISDSIPGLNYLKVNHAMWVLEGKSDRYGEDLQVVGHSNGVLSQIETYILNPDSVNSFIYFKIDKAYDQLHVYHGKAILSTDATKNPDQFEELEANEAKQSTIEQLDVVGTAKNYWVLVENSKSNNLEIRLESEYNFEEVYYFFDGDSKVKKLTASNNSVQIPVNNLDYGKHSISIVVETNAGKKRANDIDFIVSAPVYVAWTLNWAGIDPTDSSLNIVSNISQEYSIPITQFFNPRVLVSSTIPEYRKEELVSWVKKRETNGDEIAMHMHMQHDMVELAGVKSKDSLEGWYNDYRGYDLPITVYSEEEVAKILSWGIGQYEKWGLSKPEGFRAGGWFADEKTLLAIEKAGFTYDSTAHEKFEFANPTFIQSWEVSNTTQPYHPDYEDINRTDRIESMSLTEIPINGSSTFIIGYDELLANFYANYNPETIPSKTKLITFATYPEWIEDEKDNLEALFDQIGSHTHANNKGPVKYVTLEEYLETFDY